MKGALLTREQTAKLLGISARTLERYDRDGIGPGFVRVGSRMVRYDEEVCRAWAKARAFPHRAAEMGRVNPEKKTAGSTMR